ncbi:MAG: 2-hydroxyacid dehydrogenase [Chloroflexota bacterium]
MTDQPRVYLTRRIPEAGLERVRENCRAQVWGGDLPPAKDVILQEVADCEGLLCLVSDDVDAEVMDAGPLQVISQFAVGVDNIDVQGATERGIPVGHTPDVLTDATADLAFALLMAAARRIPEGIQRVRAGRWLTWEPTGLLGAQVWGATLGVVGLGRIGTAVARRGRGFDMRVLYHDPHPKPELEEELELSHVPFEELLREVDYLSIHAPLVPDTFHLVDEEALRAMNPEAFLINAARGEIVDTGALVEALRKDWIRGAALDVTDPEPLPADHPLVALPNCIVVPHIGSATVHARNQMAEIAAENLLAGLRGERLPHCVNPEVYGEVG